MTDFALWAPEHERVQLHSGQNTYELSASGDGWWRASLPQLGPGTDYSYLLDDDPEPLPDPRSLWQPKGVHSASRVYDHNAFQWTDSHWTGRALPGGVVYELHIGTFTQQ